MTLRQRSRYVPRSPCSSARRTSAGRGGELEWSFAEAGDRPIDIAEEPFRQPGLSSSLPPRGILEIGLGEWPNDEPAGHAIRWLVSSLLRSRS